MVQRGKAAEQPGLGEGQQNWIVLQCSSRQVWAVNSVQLLTAALQ